MKIHLVANVLKRPLSNERKTFMEANSYTTKTKQIIIIDNNHIIMVISKDECIQV